MVFKLDFPLCVTNGRTDGQTDGHTLLKRCKNASKKTDMQAYKCVCHYKKVQNSMHVCQYWKVNRWASILWAYKSIFEGKDIDFRQRLKNLVYVYLPEGGGIKVAPLTPSPAGLISFFLVPLKQISKIGYIRVSLKRVSLCTKTHLLYFCDSGIGRSRISTKGIWKDKKKLVLSRAWENTNGDRDLIPPSFIVVWQVTDKSRLSSCRCCLPVSPTRN